VTYLKKLGKPCLFCLILLALVLAVSWPIRPEAWAFPIWI